MSIREPFDRPWWRWPGRYRHSRGFGIHSPLAFRIITEIINSGGTGYYTETAATLPAGMSREDYRRIVALICLLRPGSVTTGHKVLDQAITTDIDSAIKTDTTEPDMIVVCDSRLPHPALLGTCLERGGTVIITDSRNLRDQISKILHGMGHGISLSGKRMVIAIGRRDIPRQHFELNF
ncbi:MAG: hypothetical protein K2I52_05545 [Muribaculaceae bacterium]|nr:hypothetical protein [Muribaculaceae bacterium]